MTSFVSDFDWQKKYYGQVESILKRNAHHIIKIEVADNDADTKQATDFVLTVKGGRVAVRVRKDVGNRYHDLTIRSKRRSGVETELQKIKKGFADFYLYIWTNKESITDWWLVDINKMRIAGLFEAPRREFWNRDGGSAFIAFAKQEIQKAAALISSKELMNEPLP